jgi:hypothetical protein
MGKVVWAIIFHSVSGRLQEWLDKNGSTRFRRQSAHR